MKNIIYLISVFSFISCQIDKKQTIVNNTVFDTVILGGRVMNPETGLDTIKNIGILDGSIHAVTDAPIKGKEVIQASGLIVTPGFIDTDGYPANADLQIADGITTVLNLRRGTGDIDNWYSEYVDKMPINYGVSVSYHDIRREVMGEDGNLRMDRIEPTSSQFTNILIRLNEEFEKGALALGMGPSGGFDPAGWELIEIFKVAAKHKAPVITTLRDDFWPESNITANLLQMIGAASLSGVDIHIPHIGSSTGPHISHFLEVMAIARASGIKVTAEDYFYRAAEIDVDKRSLYTMTNEEINQIQPMDSEVRLTRETIGSYGKKDFEAYYHNDDIEPYVVQAIKSPLVQVASHGSTSKWTSSGVGHPRTAGTYSRVLRKYVREDSVITLMEALRKMSFMPAELLSERVSDMQRKGRIRVGADADIVIFDPIKISDRATFTKQMLSTGFEYVIVNGIVVVKKGNMQTGLFPGKEVRAKVVDQSN